MGKDKTFFETLYPLVQLYFETFHLYNLYKAFYILCDNLRGLDRSYTTLK